MRPSSTRTTPGATASTSDRGLHSRRRAAAAGDVRRAGAPYEARVVPKVVVDVMPKPEILDPQGKAVLGALPRLGFTGVTDVRQGKRFEIEVPEATDEVLADIEKLADTFLANTVIENYTVRVEGR